VYSVLINCVYEPFSVNYLIIFHFFVRIKIVSLSLQSEVVRLILVPDLRLHIGIKLGIKTTDKVCFCEYKDCIFIFAREVLPVILRINLARMCVIAQDFIRSVLIPIYISVVVVR